MDGDGGAWRILRFRGTADGSDRLWAEALPCPPVSPVTIFTTLFPEDVRGSLYYLFGVK